MVGDSLLNTSERGRAGFEALLEHQLDSLYRVGLRLTRNSQEAEDLLQDMVLRALRAYESFESGTNFRSWMMTILMNTFISKYRKRMRERNVSLDLIPEPSVADSAVAGLFNELLSDQVAAALREVPEVFRAAVVLVDLEHLSYRETAKVLNCPVGTVMSRLARGRGLLRRALRTIAIEQGILKKGSA